MELLKILLQASIAFVIFNVWILRPNKSTPWRGGDADSMEEEFKAYGLPRWSMIAVGSLKLIFAFLLIAGIWLPKLAGIAATGLTATLLAAVIAHFVIRDPVIKSVPAASLLALSSAVLII